MMTKTITTITTSALLAVSAVAGDYSTPVSAPAAPAVSAGSLFNDAVSFSSGYHSKYLWRGIDFGDDMVDYGLETSVNLGGVDFTVGAWGANVFDVQGGSEVDFYASTSKDLGFATAELGYIFYYFPDATSGNTQEVYLGLSKDIGDTSVSATYYYDFDAIEESYIELGAERSLGFADASLTVGISEGGVSHIQPTLSKTLQLNSSVEFTPYVSYSFAIEDQGYGGAAIEDEFVTGAAIGFSF